MSSYREVCKSLGYPVFGKKMDGTAAAAMWQEANVSKTSQQTILRYLAAEFGTRLVVPEAEVKKFGENHVHPVPGSFISEDGKRVHYWTKPVDNVLESSSNIHTC
jgi:hypothetical protein